MHEMWKEHKIQGLSKIVVLASLLLCSVLTFPISSWANPIDVSAQVVVTSTGFLYSRASKLYTGTLTITNNGPALSGTINVALNGLPSGIMLHNATGQYNGSPMIKTSITGLATGKSITISLQFSNPNSIKITFVPVTLQEGSSAVAYQINPAHSGYATFGHALTLPPSAAWSIKLGGTASYPLIADGRAFVLTAGSSTGGYGTQLYALDLATGSTVWGPVAIPGTYYWAGHTYDNGNIFVVNSDGLLKSFDAATGTAGWSANVSGCSAPPTAANGIVYVVGGSSLQAVDERNGNILWTEFVNDGNGSSPTISNDGVFVANACDVYKFDLIYGYTFWYARDSCTGGLGKTAAYANGSLYVRGFCLNCQDGQIFDAEIGNITGHFGPYMPPGPPMPIPAFDLTAGYFLNGGTLQSENLSAQAVNWSFIGDGHLVSAPIVIDQVVIIGSSTGNVYALDAQNGSILWVGAAGSGISAPDDLYVSSAFTGFGAGEGYLVVPAGDTVTAWLLTGQ